MSDVKKLPTRDEVPKDLTWDLTRIYESDEAFEEAFKAVSKNIESLKDYQGTLGESAEALAKAYNAQLDVSRELEKVYVYTSLKSDQDKSNSKYQELNSRATSLITNYSEATAWFVPELLEISKETLNNFIESNETLQHYKHNIERITSKRDHVLSSRVEALLAAGSEISGASQKTFSMLNNADIDFPIVQDEDGNDVQISHGLYGELIRSNNRDVREKAFKAYHNTYKSFTNTLASTLEGEIKGHNYNAKAHKYSSAREKALGGNFVPEPVYDTLLEVVNENLPLFHRYLALRKKTMGLDELHMYDLYTPLVDSPDSEVSYDEAKETTLSSLNVLGEEYQGILKEAFDTRWIDVVENKGKRSGAYSSGTYDTSPYILLNWHDSLDNLYTLVHELGHSVHSYLTHNNQDYIYGDYPIFLAEIASTTNENILTSYLLDKVESKEQRIAILNQSLDGFKGTIFRQTQFAEFEHIIHQAEQDGKPLTSDFLTQTYHDLNGKYYGEPVVNDEEIGYEWSRIPHFYMNYYVFQYATGYAAATALADGIVTEGGEAIEKYLNYLRAGSSDYPVEVMKKAGVDMTKRDYLDRAFKVFEERLEELEGLLAEDN